MLDGLTEYVKHIWLGSDAGLDDNVFNIGKECIHIMSFIF